MVGATSSAKATTSWASRAVLHDASGAERQRVRLTPPRGERGRASTAGKASSRRRSPATGTFIIEAWHDRYGTWHHNAEVKIAAGVDVELMLAEGAALLAEAADDASRDGNDRDVLRRGRAGPGRHRPERRRAPGRRIRRGRHGRRRPVSPSANLSPFRAATRCSWSANSPAAAAWYEFFPRSEGAVKDHTTGAWTSGTFRTAAKRLDAVAAMGFDVVYLPPIHPIGVQHRKGPNNTLIAGPSDPGSPWAIGAAEGGHDAIHPDLGTFEDFDAFVARASELGLEVALDLALQAVAGPPLGARPTPSGSPPAWTAPSPTRRTRRRSTRTSTR